MSAHPDAAELFNHWLDASLGIACLAFLLAAAWAVAAEWRERRRLGIPLFGRGASATDPADLGGEEVLP